MSHAKSVWLVPVTALCAARQPRDLIGQWLPFLAEPPSLSHFSRQVSQFSLPFSPSFLLFPYLEYRLRPDLARHGPVPASQTRVELGLAIPTLRTCFISLSLTRLLTSLTYAAYSADSDSWTAYASTYLFVSAKQGH